MQARRNVSGSKTITDQNKLSHHEEPADGKPDAEVSVAAHGRRICVFQAVALFLQWSLLRVCDLLRNNCRLPNFPEAYVVERDDENEADGRYGHCDDKLRVHVDVRNAVQPCFESEAH